MTQSVAGVYVISYRRPRCRTAALLQKLGYPGEWHVMVESGDPFLQEYEEAFAGHVRLYDVEVFAESCDFMDNLEGGRHGAAPARNAAVAAAREDGAARFWMLDDDFNAFTRLSSDGRRRRVTGGGELSTLLERIGLVGLRTGAACVAGAFDGRRFPPKPVDWCCRAMLNVPVDAVFRSRMEEDLCFNADAWRVGRPCICLNAVGFTTPPSGEEEGGLTGMYEGGLDVRRGAYHVLANPFAKVDFETVGERGALPNLRHRVPKIVGEEHRKA